MSNPNPTPGAGGAPLSYHTLGSRSIGGEKRPPPPSPPTSSSSSTSSPTSSPLSPGRVPPPKPKNRPASVKMLPPNFSPRMATTENQIGGRARPGSVALSPLRDGGASPRSSPQRWGTVSDRASLRGPPPTPPSSSQQQSGGVGGVGGGSGGNIAQLKSIFMERANAAQAPPPPVKGRSASVSLRGPPPRPPTGERGGGGGGGPPWWANSTGSVSSSSSSPSPSPSSPSPSSPSPSSSTPSPGSPTPNTPLQRRLPPAPNRAALSSSSPPDQTTTPTTNPSPANTSAPLAPTILTTTNSPRTSPSPSPRTSSPSPGSSSPSPSLRQLPPSSLPLSSSPSRTSSPHSSSPRRTSSPHCSPHYSPHYSPRSFPSPSHSSSPRNSLPPTPPRSLPSRPERKRTAPSSSTPPRSPSVPNFPTSSSGTTPTLFVVTSSSRPPARPPPEKPSEKEEGEGEEEEKEGEEEEGEEVGSPSTQSFASMMKAALDITLTREMEGTEEGGGGGGEGEGGGEEAPRSNTRAFATRKTQLPQTQLPGNRYTSSTSSTSSPRAPPASPHKKGNVFQTLTGRKKNKESFDISAPSAFKKVDLEESGEMGKGEDGDLLDALRIAKHTEGGEGGGGMGGNGGEMGGMGVGGDALRALMEIVETERSYVLDMVLLVTHYKKPCLSNHLLPDAQAEAVFMNVEQLMHVHTKIVENFGAEPTLDSVIASYEESCPQLIKEYGTFATEYTNAIDVLDNPKLSKDFIHFCERSRQNPANKGLSLGDFLIKPIQRICKYPLLFRELLKFLDDQHPQFSASKGVKASMDLVAGRVNEARQRSEAKKILQTMEETIEGLPKDFELRSREFQFSGVLVVHGSSHKRTVFLLSDYILSCQKNRVGTGKVILKHAIPLNNQSTFTEILMAPNNGEDETKSVLKITSESERLLFDFPAKKDALEWARQFSSMQKKYLWIKNYSEKPLTQEAIGANPLSHSQQFEEKDREEGDIPLDESMEKSNSNKKGTGIGGIFGKKKKKEDEIPGSPLREEL